MNVISRFFRGGRADEATVQEGRRVSRRSNGLTELSRNLRGEEGLRVLDLGPTSPRNISYFTSLGHRIYNEDLLLASQDPSLALASVDGGNGFNVDGFLANNLVYERKFFDFVLCWDAPDYLHTDLVKPIIQRIHSVMKPKGLLLAFFHTRDAGPEAPYHRYHIANEETLELQVFGGEPAGRGRGAKSGVADARFRLQRVFNNRHIENLFHDYSSIKFFLGRDNIREVLVVR